MLGKLGFDLKARIVASVFPSALYLCLLNVLFLCFFFFLKGCYFYLRPEGDKVAVTSPIHLLPSRIIQDLYCDACGGSNLLDGGNSL